MSKPAAIVIPLRPARSRNVDLALALALLSKAVKAHEKAYRAKLAWLARSRFQSVDVYAHAKSLGA